MHQESSQELLTSSCVTAMIGFKWDPFSSGSNLMQQNVMMLLLFLLILCRGVSKRIESTEGTCCQEGWETFSRQDCVVLYWFPWPRWAPAVSQKKMDVIKPTTPKKVIVEQLNHFRLLSANICMYPIPYPSWDFGKRNTKPKPLGHWVQYIITTSWRGYLT